MGGNNLRIVFFLKLPNFFNGLVKAYAIVQESGSLCCNRRFQMCRPHLEEE